MTTKRSEPVAILDHVDDRPDWALTEERVPVFAVRKAQRADNGELIRDDNGDVVYDVKTFDMPAKPNPALALRFMKRARTEGDLAIVWLIEQAIGEAGFDALTDELETFEGDASVLLQQISTKIQSVCMGGLAPKA